MQLSKSDVRRALVAHHFSICATQMDAFEKLRSIQFDPIAPVGCNHDLVLQARVPGYKIGDWQKVTYDERQVYDGWDKQACLVPFEGWPLRRIFHVWHRPRFNRIFDEYPEAVTAVLKELEERGPLLPREFVFQERKEEWKGSWHGPNLTKQTLRALWHGGMVMTAGRRGGHHVYDLTERVVPPHLFNQPPLTEFESVRGLVLERHRAVGILRPNASQEVWSLWVDAATRRKAISELVDAGELVPVEVEGVKAHATPSFLSLLGSDVENRVVFVAPLDHFVWDRKMIAQVFGFDYIWEIYVPEVKRRWGYYVLPVLYGDALVARAEFWCRAGVLELRQWHFESDDVDPAFLPELERALRRFMDYCSATSFQAGPHIDSKVRKLAKSLSKKG